MNAPNRATRRRAAAVERSTPANRAKGETVLVVPRVGEFKLCLTLAAIAEIEDGLGVDNLQEIEAALTSAGSRQFACILAALARGGGHEEVTVDVARRWPINVQDILVAIVGAFKAAGAMTTDEYAEDAQSAGEHQAGK